MIELISLLNFFVIRFNRLMVGITNRIEICQDIKFICYNIILISNICFDDDIDRYLSRSFDCQNEERIMV